MDCIAIDRSILAMDKMFRSSVSSLLLAVAGDVAVDDFDTNNFGGEIGIILKSLMEKY